MIALTRPLAHNWPPQLPAKSFWHSRNSSTAACFPIISLTHGGKPAYNTIDASLWYFEAARQYFEATRDLATLQKLFRFSLE